MKAIFQLTLTAVLIATVGHGALLAQLNRPVNTGSQAAPGVTLSEISTFDNRDMVPYTILPYGDDFFVHTYQQFGSRGIALLGGGQQLNELAHLRLFRYGPNLKRKDEYQVAWPDEAREHLSLTSLGDRLLWTFTTETRDKDRFQISAETLDDKGKVVEHHDLLKVDRQDYQNLATFEEWSPDRQYYVRVYLEQSPQRLLSKRDDMPASLTVVVFDHLGKLITLERKRLRATRDQVELQTVAVDNDGRAYVLAKVYGNSRRREVRGGSDAKVNLYTIDEGSETMEATELKLAGQYIEGVSMVPGRDGKPAIVGVYSDRRDGFIAGYFTTDDPNSRDVLKPQPFTQEQLQAMGARITRKRGGKLVMEGQFEFRDALRLTNGHLSILLEAYTEVVSQNGGGGIGVGVGAGGFGQQTVTYNYGEGVVLEFDEKGQLNYLLVVPKFQSTSNPRSPAYRMNLVEYQGQAGVIYNDNPKNFGRDLDKRTKALRFNKAFAVIAYADNDGRLKREPLFARKEADKVILVPASAQRLKDGQVVFLALRFKSFGTNELRFGALSPGS